MNMTMTYIEDLKARLEEEGYTTTNKFEEAIYILGDGTLINGMEEGSGMNVRTVDHRMMEAFMEKGMDRYQKCFWNVVHDRFKLARLVPEEKVALIKVGQKLSHEVLMQILIHGYEVEEY